NGSHALDSVRPDIRLDDPAENVNTAKAAQRDQKEGKPDDQRQPVLADFGRRQFVERNLRVAGTARTHRVGWAPSQIRKSFAEGKLSLPVQDTSGASAHCPRSAGFQTCRIADFQIGNAPKL